MNATSAKRGVLVATMVTGAVAIVKAARAGERPRLGLGIGIVLQAVVLTALADPAPDIAVGLALLTTFGAASVAPETLASVTGALQVRRQVERRPRSTALTSPTGATTTDVLQQQSAGIMAGTANTAGAPIGPRSAFEPGHFKRNPPPLVAIGQGGHRLHPAAAAAHARASELYGQRIYVTDSYRTWDQQNAAWQSDNNRFGHPDQSRHVRGLAIDIHSDRHNLRDPRLIDAMRQTGWCQVRPDDEPWHWSFGDCG